VGEFDVQDGVPFFPLFWVDILVELVRPVFALSDKSDLWDGICADERMV
jgi:hypothetical protein